MFCLCKVLFSDLLKILALSLPSLVMIYSIPKSPAISLSISSEDVLNETVYWELTRVDAKIEEKKFDEAEKILRRWYKKNWIVVEHVSDHCTLSVVTKLINIIKISIFDDCFDVCIIIKLVGTACPV